MRSTLRKRFRRFLWTEASMSHKPQFQEILKSLRFLRQWGENGNYKYSLPPKLGDNFVKISFYSFFSDAVLSVDRAMNTVVIKCSTGMANAVCSKLDSVEYSGVVGTLAGDDTIFVLMRTEEDAVKLLEELQNIL